MYDKQIQFHKSVTTPSRTSIKPHSLAQSLTIFNFIKTFAFNEEIFSGIKTYLVSVAVAFGDFPFGEYIWYEISYFDAPTLLTLTETKGLTNVG